MAQHEIRRHAVGLAPGEPEGYSRETRLLAMLAGGGDRRSHGAGQAAVRRARIVANARNRISALWGIAPARPGPGRTPVPCPEGLVDDACCALLRSGLAVRCARPGGPGAGGRDAMAQGLAEGHYDAVVAADGLGWWAGAPGVWDFILLSGREADLRCFQAQGSGPRSPAGRARAAEPCQQAQGPGRAVTVHLVHVAPQAVAPRRRARGAPAA